MSSASPQQLLEATGELLQAVGQIAAGKQTVAQNPLLEQNALEAITKLQQLIASPGTHLSQYAITLQQLASLRWLCHFEIPKHVPAGEGESISYEDLQAKTKVPISQLRSLSRMAMTSGFLAEPEMGKVTHSRLSREFNKDPTLCDWALVVAESTAGYSFKLVEATEKFGETEDKTKTAMNLARNTDLPFFEYLKTDPVQTKKFASYMKNVTSSPATSLQHVVKAFDWASLPQDGVVVDVGGSTGHASLVVAESFPHLKFVVQDLPDTIKTSALDTSKLPSDVASRLSFQGHDFMDPQPVKDAAAYFLRTIIHDWPRTEAIKILSIVADAMGPNSKLLIMDIVLPKPNTGSLFDEMFARMRDLTMIETFNAKEREIPDWEDLLSATGKGLKLVNVIKPTGSSLSVIEVVKA